MIDQLLWGAPEWAWPALGLGVLLSAIVLWAYLTVSSATAIRAVCAALKIAAVVLVAVCLLQPMRRGSRPRPQANLLPILVDTSKSMSVKSAADSTRHDRISALVNDQQPWLRRLAQAFDVRRYAFDDRLHNVDDFTHLQAEGASSALADSLKSLSERFAERPVAGMILMSDGNLTDSPAPDFAWQSIGFPVYPVIPAADQEIVDLRIVDVHVRQTDFETAPTTVTVTYDTVGSIDGSVTVRLTDLSTGKIVEEQSQAVSPGDAHKQATFRFRPESAGISFHQAAVALDSGKEREATLANNQRLLAIERSAGPYRVLYIAGRPNWEFKFLRRALQAEAEVQLVGLIRIAKQEPKFSFRDQEVSDTNPLFRGLGEGQEEAAEQYDEPVIIRLGVKAEEELSDGFPNSEEELFAYQGIILDDIESGFFSQDQLLLLRRFVSSRGGGLLMLGGTESFAGKAFADTPLGELSPVYPARGAGDKPNGPYRIALTREGMLEPWIRLRETEAAEQDRLESMPPFATLNRVGESKPGAASLAVVQNGDDREHPALVVQRFGKGRTAALLLGDLWRWSMHNPSAEQSAEAARRVDDPAQAWRQLARWLVNDVPRRVEMEIQSDDHHRSVSIIVRVRDESYHPLDNASVELTIHPVGGESFQVTAEMDESQEGTYHASCWSPQPGGYRVEARVQAADGSPVGTAESGWASQPAAAELANLSTNRTLLAEIAEATGGELIRDVDLDRFADELPTRKVPVTESWIYPIWHRPWVMITAILCLCGEWGLRRWKGLA